MANLLMTEDASSLEITTHLDSKLWSSLQHDNSNWHGIGSISLLHDVVASVVEEIDESARVAEAGDDGGGQSLHCSERHEINGNMIEVGLRGVEVISNDTLIYSYHGDPTWITTSPVSPLPFDIVASPLSDNPSLVPKGGDVDKTQQHQHPKKQLGSFFMGWVGVVFKRNISLFSEALAIGLSSGLMGSITTFTSWIQAMVKLTTEGHWVAGIIGLLLGMELAQMSLALGIESAKLITYAHSQIKKQQLVLKWIPSSEYYHCGLYGFVMFMIIIGVLWGGSLVLSVFGFTSHHTKKLWIACMVGPFGVWVRWYVARLNGQGIGSRKHLNWLPIGTLLTNLMSSINMAALSTIHLVVKDDTEKIVIEALQLGFLGNMSTVSAFVVEV